MLFETLLPYLGNLAGINSTPSNSWFLGPTTHSNGILIGSADVAGLMKVTNRQAHTRTQTDHATPSVAISPILLLLRCGLKFEILTADRARVNVHYPTKFCGDRSHRYFI